ncbi:hypothetical protein HAX54_007881 [Datura stramonium]|uniref:Uncharacterized protein n=1 Tax=Datura stramonium TaxID=4076 RepID=A0ABS8WYX5_DATST|nr:hypothetical protein [Datura stramonium]
MDWPYMVYLPSEGVIVPIQKRNKIRFTEPRGRKKVRFVGDKPRAAGLDHTVERALKGSCKPHVDFRALEHLAVTAKPTVTKDKPLLVLTSSYSLALALFHVLRAAHLPPLSFSP